MRALLAMDGKVIFEVLAVVLVLSSEKLDGKTFEATRSTADGFVTVTVEIIKRVG